MEFDVIARAYSGTEVLGFGRGKGRPERIANSRNRLFPLTIDHFGLPHACY